jgi:SAM-dependent methyltransferase
MSTQTPPKYVLGSDDSEVARLDLQAATLAPPTAFLLRAAGIAEGMRVLDAGTGLGHVAFAIADMVGQHGSVQGLDQSDDLLAIADERRAAVGRENVRFRRADVRSFSADEPFDALVTRLLLFHLPDAVDVLRRLTRSLRPGGLVVALDFDIGALRSEPEIPLVARGTEWVEAAFRAAGANPRIGARLALLLRDAGVTDLKTYGVQSYLPPDDPAGPALLAGVVRSLAPKIVAEGIATEAEIGLETLHERIAAEVRRADAVVIPPALVGAWGRAPASDGTPFA